MSSISALQSINSLATALLSSASAGDWQALARHDVAVSQLMAKLQPVPAHLQAGVELLKKAHVKAQVLARQEAARLQQKLQQLEQQQEGLRAYQQMEDLG